jgi:flagella basal body P-ring formation protein FlgA
MSKYLHIVMAALACTALQLAHADDAPPRQDLEVLRKTAEQFLQTQANGLPGEVNVTIGAVDARLKLPACTTPEAFLPPSGKAWGRTTVGVRCTAPAKWTIYVSATVKVVGEYIAAAAPLAQGQTISQADIGKVKGDLSALPAGVITDPNEAIGRTVANNIPLGAPLRQDALRNQRAITQGQGVRVVVNGPGFSVTSEAKALNNANEGQMTQVRTPNGQVISGIAKLGGVVELAY